MKKAQKDTYGFMKVGKKKYVYHPWKSLSSRGYIVTDKQRNEIIDFNDLSLMVLSFGLVFFIRKKRFSAANLDRYFWVYYIGIAYYILAIIFLKIKKHLILRGCERVRCKRESIFSYMKSLTSTVGKRHILLFISITLIVVMIERFIIHQYKAMQDIPSLIFMWFFGFITVFMFLICYKIIQFKIQYKYNLRKNLCIKEYENNSVTASDVMYFDWRGLLSASWSQMWPMILILLVLFISIVFYKLFWL